MQPHGLEVAVVDMKPLVNSTRDDLMELEFGYLHAYQSELFPFLHTKV